MTDLLAFHRTALLATVGLVNGVERFDLPTPCDGWDLARLVAHMTGQNRGFAAAARGDGFDPRTWAESPAGAGEFAASADEVLEAFAADGATGREWSLLAGRDTAMTVPGRTAVGFHFIDYVAHAWDVGASVGAKPEFESALLEVVLPLAYEVPLEGPARTGPYAPFAPAVAAGPGAGPMDRFLAVLGRDPGWEPPA